MGVFADPLRTTLSIEDIGWRQITARSLSEMIDTSGEHSFVTDTEFGFGLMFTGPLAYTVEASSARGRNAVEDPYELVRFDRGVPLVDAFIDPVTGLFLFWYEDECYIADWMLDSDMDNDGDDDDSVARHAGDEHSPYREDEMVEDLF